MSLSGRMGDDEGRWTGFAVRVLSAALALVCALGAVDQLVFRPATIYIFERAVAEVFPVVAPETELQSSVIGGN